MYSEFTCKMIWVWKSLSLSSLSVWLSLSLFLLYLPLSFDKEKPFVLVSASALFCDFLLSPSGTLIFLTMVWLPPEPILFPSVLSSDSY